MGPRIPIIVIRLAESLISELAGHILSVRSNRLISLFRNR